MRLNVPFLYHAKGIRNGCRKPEDVLLLGYEPLDIPDLTSAQAPVAVRLPLARRQTLTQLRTPWGDIPEGHQGVEFRALRGELVRAAEVILGGRESRDRYPNWRPVCRDDVQARLDIWAAEALLPPIYRGPHPLLLGKGEGGDGRAYNEREWAWREELESERAGVVAELHKVAHQQSAFVDGVLYGPTAGPGWRPTTVWTGGRHVTLSLVPEMAWLSAEGRQNAVPLTRREDAVDMARDMARRGRVALVEPDYGAAVQMLMPGMLSGEVDLNSALRDAATALLSKYGAKIAEAPSDTIRLYADLVDALAGAREAPHDGDAYDNLLEAADRLNDRWTALCNGRVQGGPHNPMVAFARKAAVARGVLPEQEGALVVDAEMLRRIGGGK